MKNFHFVVHDMFIANKRKNKKYTLPFDKLLLTMSASHCPDPLVIDFVTVNSWSSFQVSIMVRLSTLELH